MKTYDPQHATIIINYSSKHCSNYSGVISSIIISTRCCRSDDRRCDGGGSISSSHFGQDQWPNIKSRSELMHAFSKTMSAFRGTSQTM